MSPLTDIQVDYPTGYDDASTIMGIAENRMTFTLNGGLSVSSVQMTIDDGGEVLTVSVNSGGSNYIVGDDLTIVGGDDNCIVNVESVSSGAVTGVAITDGGSAYSTGTGKSTTGGTGSGCTLDIDTIHAPDLQDLDLPCFLVFAGGEIWYIEDGDVDTATQLSIDFDQRAQLGTSVQIHSDGEKVYSYFSGKQHEMLRDILVNKEKFPIVQGVQNPTPTVVGEAYIDSNYDIWVCFDMGGTPTYTKLVSGKHTSLSDVPSGSTATPHGDNYMHGQNSTFTDWHDGLTGDHITGGNDHTHLVDASPVERVAYGSALPTGDKIGQIFLKNGDLYFIYDSGLEFEEFFGIPSGSILPFDPDDLIAGACPDGWSAYSALNNSAYVRIGIDATGDTGGSNTHTHTVSEIEAHTHTIAQDTCESSYAGTHSHTFYVSKSDPGAVKTVGQHSGLCAAVTGPGGSHIHDGEYGSQEATDTTTLTSGSMSSNFVTDSASTEPAYKTMKWCQKD